MKHGLTEADVSKCMSSSISLTSPSLNHHTYVFIVNLNTLTVRHADGNQLF